MSMESCLVSVAVVLTVPVVVMVCVGVLLRLKSDVVFVGLVLLIELMLGRVGTDIRGAAVDVERGAMLGSEYRAVGLTEGAVMLLRVEAVVVSVEEVVVVVVEAAVVVVLVGVVVEEIKEGREELAGVGGLERGATGGRLAIEPAEPAVVVEAVIVVVVAVAAWGVGGFIFCVAAVGVEAVVVVVA